MILSAPVSNQFNTFADTKVPRAGVTEQESVFPIIVLYETKVGFCTSGIFTFVCLLFTKNGNNTWKYRTERSYMCWSGKNKTEQHLACVWFLHNTVLWYRTFILLWDFSIYCHKTWDKSNVFMVGLLNAHTWCIYACIHCITSNCVFLYLNT